MRWQRNRLVTRRFRRGWSNSVAAVGSAGRAAHGADQPAAAPGGGHGEPTPAGRSAVEYRPDQGDTAVLTGQTADHLHSPTSLAKGAFDEVRMAYLVPVLAWKAQVDGQRVAVSEQAAHRGGVAVTPAVGERVDPMLGEFHRVQTGLDVCG